MEAERTFRRPCWRPSSVGATTRNSRRPSRRSSSNKTASCLILQGEILTSQTHTPRAPDPSVGVPRARNKCPAYRNSLPVSRTTSHVSSRLRPLVSFSSGSIVEGRARRLSRPPRGSGRRGLQDLTIVEAGDHGATAAVGVVVVVSLVPRISAPMTWCSFVIPIVIGRRGMLRSSR